MLLIGNCNNECAILLHYCGLCSSVDCLSYLFHKFIDLTIISNITLRIMFSIIAMMTEVITRWWWCVFFPTPGWETSKWPKAAESVDAIQWQCLPNWSIVRITRLRELREVLRLGKTCKMEHWRINAAYCSTVTGTNAMRKTLILSNGISTWKAYGTCWSNG